MCLLEHLTTFTTIGRDMTAEDVLNHLLPTHSQHSLLAVCESWGWKPVNEATSAPNCLYTYIHTYIHRHNTYIHTVDLEIFIVKIFLWFA